MSGYKLSREAARAQQSWDATRSAPAEYKQVVGLNDPLGNHYGVSRHDGTNFRTNTVTLAQYNDHQATTAIGALGLATSWSCINLLAGTVGSLPAMVYRGSGDARQVDPNHSLYRLLHDSPNAEQTAVDFWEFIQASLELEGHAYSQIKRIGNRITSLMPPIAPSLMTRRPLPNGDTRYEWVDRGERHTCTSRDMFHIRGPLGGASTLSVCRRVFRAAMNIDHASDATFGNGVRASGILKVADTLVGDQRQDLEGFISERYVGAMNAGVPMVLDRGMSWEQLTINPEDAQMLESRGFSVEEICRVFGVPPHMVGHTAGNTQLGSSITEQTRGFEKFTLRRRVKRLEMAAMKQLLTPRDVAEGVTFGFNMEGLLRGSSEERSKFYESALGDTQRPGWMVRNEVRRLENLAPMPGWDEPIPLISQAQPGATPPGVE